MKKKYTQNDLETAVDRISRTKDLRCARTLLKMLDTNTSEEFYGNGKYDRLFEKMKTLPCIPVHGPPNEYVIVYKIIWHNFEICSFPPSLWLVAEDRLIPGKEAHVNALLTSKQFGITEASNKILLGKMV